MAKQNNKNGKAFQSKFSMEQLRTEVLMNKKSAAEICEKYEIRPYTLQSKLYEAALKASNKTESLKFILDITIPSRLCDHLGITVGSIYEVSLDNKKIVLTPTK
jgi:hypothetical protein